MSHLYRGVVMEGQGRAAKLGFPTVNIPLPDDSVSGIYAAQVAMCGVSYYAAVFADPKRKLLEAHLLDFSGTVYGKEIVIELFEKLRESAPFTSDIALARMIAADVAGVRNYFSMRQSLG